MEEVPARVDLRDSEGRCGDTALGRVRRALETVPPGELLEVRSDVPEQVLNVRLWARHTGREIVAEEEAAGLIRLLLRQPSRTL